MEGENTADKLVVKFKGSTLIYESGPGSQEIHQTENTICTKKSVPASHTGKNATHHLHVR